MEIRAARALLDAVLMSCRDHQYTLGPLVGEGGMGRVFAVDHTAKQPLVMKVLHEALEGDPLAVARLQQEASAARQVSHRNVVRVVGEGRLANGSPYLVMKRAAGVPLGSLIADRGPLPLTKIRAIASQMLAGLAAIHCAGLVHGDMKSDNVLVDDKNRVTIIDFGLARPHSTRALGTIDGMMSGTPEYMAPELVRGEPMTAASEVYAVGVIVYEMLTGQTPFGGGTLAEVLERHLNDDVVPPSLRVPQREIPIALEAIVLRALAKEPDSRPFDAAFFGTAVERAIPNRTADRFARGSRPALSTTLPTRSWGA